MNIIDNVYRMRKRIKDIDLLKIQEIITTEIERRKKADDINSYKR